MVSTDLVWVKLNIKQCFREMSFYVMLASTALVIYLLSCISVQNRRNVNVLMVCEDSEVGGSIGDELIEEASLGYDFSYVDSREELIRRVTTGEADCGIVFESRLDSKIDRGELRGAVAFYQYSGSSAGYLVREVVFPHLLKRVSNRLIEDYISEQDSGTPRAITDLIKQSNDDFVKETDISIFTIEEIERHSKNGESSVSYRGCVIAFISIFATIIMVAENERNNHNYYKALKKGLRVRRRVEAACVRVVLIGAMLTVLTTVLL